MPSKFKEYIGYSTRNQMTYLGNLSAAPPDRSVKLSCARCQVMWTGCADAYECPRCGGTDAWDAFEAISRKLFPLQKPGMIC